MESFKGRGLAMAVLKFLITKVSQWTFNSHKDDTWTAHYFYDDSFYRGLRCDEGVVWIFRLWLKISKNTQIFQIRILFLRIQIFHNKSIFKFPLFNRLWITLIAKWLSEIAIEKWSRNVCIIIWQAEKFSVLLLSANIIIWISCMWTSPCVTIFGGYFYKK